MQWTEFLFNHLEINDQQSVILQDECGIIQHHEFQGYLQNNGIHFVHSNELHLLIEKSKSSSPVVIISNLKDVPSFLSNKIEIKRIGKNDFPLHFDVSFSYELNTQELVALLQWQASHSDSRQMIHNDNYQRFIDEGNRQHQQEELHQLESQLQSLHSGEITIDSILEMGDLWGKLVYSCWKANTELPSDIMNTLDDAIEKFVIGGSYQNAFYAQSHSFRTVDKIRNFLKDSQNEKIALICFDGMGMAEWRLLQSYLSPLKVHFQEKQIFALLPTITLISRSAIYYGDYERVYSIKYSNEEKELREGLPNRTIKWFKEGNLKNEDQLLGIDLVSIIYNVFDELCHSTHIPPNEIKKDHYFENVENYLKRSPILRELELLLEHGYQLYFCSDHGSVLAEGNGAKLEKYLVDSYSKRGSTVEPSSLLDDSSYMIIDIPFIQDKKYLCAPKRTLFASEGTKAITHGGITLDELVIPFVKVNQ